jgi:hypothetical protein
VWDLLIPRDCVTFFIRVANVAVMASFEATNGRFATKDILFGSVYGAFLCASVDYFGLHDSKCLLFITNAFVTCQISTVRACCTSR